MPGRSFPRARPQCQSFSGSSQVAASLHAAAARTVDGMVYSMLCPVHPLFCLPSFELYIVVLEVGSGPIGFVAPCSFKVRVSQLVQSNAGSVSIRVHDSGHIQKSWHDFLARYSSCFRPDRIKLGFLNFTNCSCGCRNASEPGVKVGNKDSRFLVHKI